MKKRILLFTALFAFILNVSAQKSIIKDAFEQLVEYKIASIQKAIPITEKQAEELKSVELKFLIDVNAAENCFLCRKQRRIKKLKTKKGRATKKNIKSRSVY
ncbi:MAG: hypothetical protein PHN55_10675 [Dysgonamonadaceae bacterium]|nr:hypothetical protein [Dysgonamonadaceae bacterium]